MSQARILLLEDSTDLQKEIVSLLKSEYTVDVCGDGESALARLATETYDLVIADIGLPKMDGYAFCAALKSERNTAGIPVLFLSGRAQVEDKLVGFSVGGSDFLSKPFDPRELKARIKIQLLSRTQARIEAKHLSVGPFQLNMDTRAALCAMGGANVKLILSPLEFKLLHFFLSHAEHVLTRAQLLDQVWGAGEHVSDRSVDVVISRLRQKLGEHSHLLQSVRGEGYRFSVPAAVKRAV